MKIGIISDVHGNYEALKIVFEYFENNNIKDIICLGDVVGYYSQVNECCELLQNHNVKCVMGNHDWYLTSGTDCPRSKSVNDCLGYQKKIITKKNIEWIKSFPVYMMYEGIHCVHGGWVNPIDEYIQPTPEYFYSIKGKFFASGHNHVQTIVEWETGKYCNPGSIGQPRDGDNRTAFAVFDGKKFKLHRLEYDYARVGELMELAGFNQYYYKCLWDASAKLHS